MNIQPAPVRYDLPLNAILSRVSKAIVTGKIFLAQTPGTEYLLQCLVRLITIDGLRGMVIGAATTFGKTKCLHYILNALPEVTGALFPFLIVEKLPPRASAAGSLLLAIGAKLGLAMTSYTPIDHRIQAIVLAFYQYALKSEYRTVILAIDEAQDVTPEQLRLLKTIGNYLEDMHCDLFLILCGQESLFRQEEMLDECAPLDADQLAERFLHNYRLHGFTSQEQLKGFLESFDLAEYPRGYSVVGRYLPRAVAAGFKVAQWDEPMWAQIKLANPETVRTKAEIGTGHTVQMLAKLLYDSAPNDATNFVRPADPGAFEKALAETRYARSVVKRYRPAKGDGADARI